MSRRFLFSRRVVTRRRRWSSASIWLPSLTWSGASAGWSQTSMDRTITYVWTLIWPTRYWAAVVSDLGCGCQCSRSRPVPCYDGRVSRRTASCWVCHGLCTKPASAAQRRVWSFRQPACQRREWSNYKPSGRCCRRHPADGRWRRHELTTSGCRRGWDSPATWSR